jgi:polyisoprenoid-binding protein YceI
LVILTAGPVAALRAQTPADLVTHGYNVDSQHSSVAFAATILGAVKVRGRFTDYQSLLIYDPAYPERASVSAVIQATSITTDMPFRDDHLRTPDFFDVKQFPLITFESDQVVPTPSGLQVSGALTMHGVSQRVTFPAIVVLAPIVRPWGVQAGFSAQLRVSRAAFGIAGTNKFNPDFNPLTSMISDSVEITLDLFTQRENHADNQLGGGNPPGVADTVFRELESRGVGPALTLYRTLRSGQPTAYSFSPGQLDRIGHRLADRGRVSDAVTVLRFNADMFAETNGVLESLGEAQALANDRAGALATYRSALARFPTSASAREMVRRLEHLQ